MSSANYSRTFQEENMDDENTTWPYDYDDASPCEMKPRDVSQTTSYIYSLICVLGLVGNILVLITYALYKKAKSKTDIFLMNVALADLLFVLALPLIIYNDQNNWSMGLMACKLLSGTYSINLYSSVLLLACISADRYFSITKAKCLLGMHRKGLIYTRFICVIIWLLAIVLSMPTFIYSNPYKESDDSTMYCIMVFQNDTAKLMKILIPSTQVSVGFILPLLIMAFCYGSVIITLLSAKNYHKHKALRVIFVVVIVFILCHLPYNANVVIHTSRLQNKGDCQIEQNILLSLAITRSLAYLHCCLNPILYAFIGVNFRNRFWQIMKDLWCTSKKYFSRHSSSQQTSEFYIPIRVNTEPNQEQNSSFTM